MSERTWEDSEREYIEAEELAHRLGIKFVGNEYVAEEEYEDDWVRLIDVAPVIAQLEAELAAHLENEGDECPLCIAEAENERLNKAFDWSAAKVAEARAENEELRELFVYFFGENYEELVKGEQDA